jgi:hypothetical protein
MKTKDKLADWLYLKNRDYKEGVQLFIDLNINVEMMRYFQQGEDKIHRVLLNRQLEQYARVNKIRPQKYVEPEKPDVKKISKQSGKNAGAGNKQTANTDAKIKTPPAAGKRVLVDTNPSVRFEDLPEKLQDKFREAGQLRNEMKTYHAELKAIKDDQDKQDRRTELANLIVNAEKTVKENWQEIDQWWEDHENEEPTKETPEEKAVREALEKDKRIKANLNYLKRYKNSKKQKQQKELEQRKKELDNWGVDYAKVLK